MTELKILNEVKDSKGALFINSSSLELNLCLLQIAKVKLCKSLPGNISEAFKYIDEFEQVLNKEYSAKYINTYEFIIEGLKVYVLRQFQDNKQVDIKSFLFSLSEDDDRENHLFSFERSFFKFLPYSKYSSKDIMDICDRLCCNETKQYYVVNFLRGIPNQNIEKAKILLEYSINNDVSLNLISDLLIGLYNAGDKYLNNCVVIWGIAKVQSKERVMQNSYTKEKFRVKNLIFRQGDKFRFTIALKSYQALHYQELAQNPTETGFAVFGILKESNGFLNIEIQTTQHLKYIL